MHDLGAVFERVPSPAATEKATTLLDGVLMFTRYFEQNEHFDLLTHGMGPGLVAIVMHSFSDFMGDLMGQKLDHNATYRGKRLFPNMYLDKLRKIIDSIVVDKQDEYMGKMLKEQKEKEKPVTKKKKTLQKKQPEKINDETSSEDIEIVSDNESCSTNENDFTTLTSGTGKAYFPPSKVTSKSRFSRKGHEDDDIIVRIENMRRKLEKQQKKINFLTTENNNAKETLRKLRARNPSPSGRVPSKDSSSKLFTENIVVDSSEEEEKGDVQADSTQVAATGSDAGSIPCSGVVRRKQKRARIDSDSLPQSESEGETEKLLKSRAEMEEKLKVAQKKLLDQKMANKARDFHDFLVSGMRDFRSDLMDCYGADKFDDRLQAARSKFGDRLDTVSNMGYTFRVGEDFLGRVEKSILSGQTPEQQCTCTRIDNSISDPILGDVTDIIYEISMPVIVKREPVKDDDDDAGDCEILSVQPAPVGFTMNVKVKEEKLDTDKKKKEKSQEHDDTGSGVAAENNNTVQKEIEEAMTEASEGEDVVNTPKKAVRRGKRNQAVEPLKKMNLRSKTHK